MGRSRYKIFDNTYPHFLTCTVQNWLPLFAEPGVVQIVLDSLEFMQNENRLQIFAYIVMENHLHMIASSNQLSDEIGKFKSYTARKIIDLYKMMGKWPILDELNSLKLSFKKDREYQFWQEGSHPEQIILEDMMRQKIEYIHFNPVRRGYVDEPEHWRYSSARNYRFGKGLIEVCTNW